MTEKGPRNLALTEPKYIFENNKPQLIKQWQLVTKIWDSVRHECDNNHEKVKFILTGSTSLSKETSGSILITDLFDNKVKEGHTKKSLLRFYDNVKKKPKFMCIIMGY